MTQDIRRKTCLIIRTTQGYFGGWNELMGRINWRISMWNAWRTRDAELAKQVAEKVGGTLYLFNPIIGKSKLYEEG